MAIRNPAEWGSDQIEAAGKAVRAVSHALARPETEIDHSEPVVRTITIADLREVLRKGFADFAARRTDVIFVGIIYPLAGLVLARLAMGYDLLPLVFPLASGFALVGPFAAAGLYEMSRRRERGEEASWVDAFGVYRNPSFGAIVELGLVLVAIFLAWLAIAMGIYQVTLGPGAPTSVRSFVTDVFTTSGGWALLVVGIGTGFLLALLVLAISAISFPLLVDRRVSVGMAIRTSVRAMQVNPVPMIAWGAIVAVSLVLGAIPLLTGLIIVVPVLGHATWHLYRAVVEPVPAVVAENSTSSPPMEGAAKPRTTKNRRARVT